MNSLANTKNNSTLINQTADFQLPVLIVDAGESAEKRFIKEQKKINRVKKSTAQNQQGQVFDLCVQIN